MYFIHNAAFVARKAFTPGVALELNRAHYQCLETVDANV